MYLLPSVDEESRKNCGKKGSLRNCHARLVYYNNVVLTNNISDPISPFTTLAVAWSAADALIM